MLKLIVIDDFYKDPEAVRELALSADYEDVTHLNYPGFQSLKAFVSTVVLKKFEDMIGDKLSINHHETTFGKFRLMPKGKDTHLKVHVDGISGWTAVLYLSPDKDCIGGTSFYRHRVTGLYGPPGPEELSALGYKDYIDFERRIVVPQSIDESAWEEVEFVAMKFNRLVIFRGNEMFHSHTVSFGTDKKTARMTQNFFFTSQNIDRVVSAQ